MNEVIEWPVDANISDHTLKSLVEAICPGLNNPASCINTT